MYRAKLQAQLKHQSIHDPTSGCWVWQGQIANSGRGRMMVRKASGAENQLMSVEDVSYQVFLGEIPAKSLVRQHCGNRLCINPEHLVLFTP